MSPTKNAGDLSRLDELYYTFQHELALNGIRVSFYMHGGACVALLALLPHMLTTSLKAVLPWGIGALFLFSLGVGVAGAAHHVMYRTSVVFQGKDPKSPLSRGQWRCLSFSLQIGAILLFFFGALTMGGGLLSAWLDLSK